MPQDEKFNVLITYIARLMFTPLIGKLSFSQKNVSDVFGLKNYCYFN